MRLPFGDHTRRPCHSELVELFRRRSRCLASPFRVRLRAMPYAQDDTAKKREANADAESRAASLKNIASPFGRGGGVSRRRGYFTAHPHTTLSCEDYSSTTSWSPFPHKGRLNVTRFAVLYIFICLYTIINKSSKAQTTPTSLPL